MMISGGYIVVGADYQGRPSDDVVHPELPEIRSAVHHHQKSVLRGDLRGAASGRSLCLERVGAYAEAKGQVIVFRAGDVSHATSCGASGGTSRTSHGSSGGCKRPQIAAETRKPRLSHCSRASRGASTGPGCGWRWPSCRSSRLTSRMCSPPMAPSIPMGAATDRQQMAYQPARHLGLPTDPI